MGHIGNDEVDCMSLLCSCTNKPLYHLPYDRGSAQWLTIHCGDRRRSIFLDLSPSCLNCLQSELIRNRHGDEIVSGPQVNEH